MTCLRSCSDINRRLSIRLNTCRLQGNVCGMQQVAVGSLPEAQGGHVSPWLPHEDSFTCWCQALRLLKPGVSGSFCKWGFSVGTRSGAEWNPVGCSEQTVTHPHLRRHSRRSDVFTVHSHGPGLLPRVSSFPAFFLFSLLSIFPFSDLY